MEYNKILSDVEGLSTMYDNDACGIDYERIRKIADYINKKISELALQLGIEFPIPKRIFFI